MVDTFARPTLGCSVAKLTDVSRTLAGDPAARRAYATDPRLYLEGQGVRVSAASLSSTTRLTTSEICTAIVNCLLLVNLGDSVNAVQKVNAAQLANAVAEVDVAAVVEFEVPGQDGSTKLTSEPCSVL